MRPLPHDSKEDSGAAVLALSVRIVPRCASSRGRSGRCPLDEEPFQAAECSVNSLPARKANSFKVYCWNKEHGCKFEGVMEGMLRHYERECTFHRVECLRCGQGVQHRELPAHYVARCSADASSTPATRTTSESTELTLQAVRNAFQEVKTLLRDRSNERLLPAIQSLINELAEEVRNHEYRSALVTSVDAASSNAEMAQATASTPRNPLPEQEIEEAQPKTTSWPNPALEASSSTPSLLRSQEASEPPDRHHLPDLSQSVVLRMRKTSAQEYPRHVIDHGEFPNAKCNLTLTAPPSTTLSWRAVSSSVKYVLTLENLNEIASVREVVSRVAKVTVWHTRDAHFVVEVTKCGYHLFVFFQFHGLLGDSPSSAPSVCVRAYDWERRRMVSTDTEEQQCDCNRRGNTWAHFKGRFSVNLAFHPPSSYLRDGIMQLEIELSRN